MERCPDSVYFIRCIIRTNGGYVYWNGNNWTRDITKAEGYVDKPTKLPKEEEVWYTRIEVISLDACQTSRR